MQTPTSIPTLQREGDLLRVLFGNGCEISLDCHADRMNGIRHVSFRGKPLRSPQEAIRPEIATPDGREVDHFKLLDARVEGDAVVIETRPWWRTAHRMEWQEHGGHQRISTTSWSNGAWPEESHRLVWRLRAERDVFGGREYGGFSYAYTYDCPGYAIFQLEDKASWELGGRAAGNTWIMRNTFAPSVRMLDNGGFDSGWTLPGIANPWIFQHLPLVSCLGGFTFQHDADRTLVTVPERPSHVRSLFHQDAGSDLLLHFNQVRFCQRELGFTYFVETPGLPQCGTAYRWLHGNEWLFDDLRTPYESNDMAKLGIAPVDAYFRGMANRLFLAPLVNPRLWPAPEAHQQWYDPVAMAALNHGFLQVESLLDRRRLLPDGQGVAWRAADGTEVVFAFRDFTHPLAGRAEAAEMVAGGACDAGGGRLRCAKNRIYRIRAASCARCVKQ